MRKTSHFNGPSLMVGCVVAVVFFFFSNIPGANADFADKHLRLYLSLGWKLASSSCIEDEMREANYDQVKGSGTYPIGSATLMYSFNPRLSIGIEGWWTEMPKFEGRKTRPLIFYAYYEGTMDTTTYSMDMRGEEYFHVSMIGPAVQWILTSRESRQFYIRGMIGITTYSSDINRYPTWSSGGTPTYSVLAFDWESRHVGTYGAGLTLGGDLHASWISLGLEAAVRYSSPKTIEIPHKRADTIIAGGFVVKPEEGGIIMPTEKRKLNFWGVSLGVVLGFHAF